MSGLDTPSPSPQEGEKREAKADVHYGLERMRQFEGFREELDRINKIQRSADHIAFLYSDHQEEIPSGGFIGISEDEYSVLKEAGYNDTDSALEGVVKLKKDLIRRVRQTARLQPLSEQDLQNADILQNVIKNPNESGKPVLEIYYGGPSPVRQVDQISSLLHLERSYSFDARKQA